MIEILKKLVIRIANVLRNKVDKIDNHSLVHNDEISRLRDNHFITNIEKYDRNLIFTTDDNLHNSIDISDRVTVDRVTASIGETVVSYSYLGDLTRELRLPIKYPEITYSSGILSYDNTEINLDNYYVKKSDYPTDLETKLNLINSKVDKVPGKSLISLSDLAKIAEIDGKVSKKSGYSLIPDSTLSKLSNISNWDIAYSKSVKSMSFSGNERKTLTLTLQDGSTLTSSFDDITGLQTDVHVNSASFNSGVLKIVNNEGQVISVNIDGRYSQLNHTHSYNDLTDKPNFNWDSISGKPNLVLSSDSRLSNSRPASDVYAWAKSPTKPYYDWGEIRNKPTIPDVSGYFKKLTSGTVPHNSTFRSDDSGIYSTDNGGLSVNFNLKSGPTSGLQLYTKKESGHLYFRYAVDNNRFSTFKSLANLGEVVRLDHDTNLQAKVTYGSNSSNRDAGLYGNYNHSRYQHIWSIGTAYKISPTGDTLGNLYGLAYMYHATDFGGAHQVTHVNNGQILTALGTYLWTRNGIKINGLNDSYIPLCGGSHKHIDELLYGGSTTFRVNRDLVSTKKLHHYQTPNSHMPGLGTLSKGYYDSLVYGYLGKVEITGKWYPVADQGLYYRTLRNVDNNWTQHRKLLDWNDSVPVNLLKYYEFSSNGGGCTYRDDYIESSFPNGIASSGHSVKRGEVYTLSIDIETVYDAGSLSNMPLHFHVGNSRGNGNYSIVKWTEVPLMHGRRTLATTLYITDDATLYLFIYDSRTSKPFKLYGASIVKGYIPGQCERVTPDPKVCYFNGSWNPNTVPGTYYRSIEYSGGNFGLKLDSGKLHAFLDGNIYFDEGRYKAITSQVTNNFSALQRMPEIQDLSNKSMIKSVRDWLYVNGDSHFLAGTYLGNKVVRTDNKFLVGPEGEGSMLSRNRLLLRNGSAISYLNLGGNGLDLGVNKEYLQFYNTNYVRFKSGTGTNGSNRVEFDYVNNRVLLTDMNIERTQSESGYLIGSYNNDGNSNIITGPIYTIGRDYKPARTSLGNMYGIGYTYTSASFINESDLGRTPESSWGIYVAADGNARIYLSGSHGHGYFKGNVHCNDLFVRSDISLKSNITRIENALDKVCQLSGYTFDIDNTRSTGVIAQEVEKVLPEVVDTSETGLKSVSYQHMIGLLIEAIKELRDEYRNTR